MEGETREEIMKEERKNLKTEDLTIETVSKA